MPVRNTIGMINGAACLLQAASPICIIHGPFGCGKSTLLVALLHYLLAQKVKQEGPLKGCRVLVTAHTNIAVDRVISGLIDSGCRGRSCSNLNCTCDLEAQA